MDSSSFPIILEGSMPGGYTDGKQGKHSLGAPGTDAMPMPALMGALHGTPSQAQKSWGPARVAAVRKALQRDPDAAVSPFFDHAMEPPLCCAARLSCEPEVFKLLLDHGADVDAVNVHGETPLGVLCATSARVSMLHTWCLTTSSEDCKYIVQQLQEDCKSQFLSIARILLEDGADPMDDMRAGTGKKTCLEHFRSIDNDDILLDLL